MIIGFANEKETKEKMELIATYSLQLVLLATLIIALWKYEWIWVLGCLAGFLQVAGFSRRGQRHRQPDPAV